MLKGASVLVSGGSGSFGNAFVRRALKDGARRVICFSRGEHAQEAMAREIADPALRFFIGDVRDRDRLEMAMRGVDLVVHAAALKIVPIAEYNPFEAVHTNILGAQNVIEAAIRCGVKRVVALSTDKASAPLNLYGATKLCAERLFCAAHAYAAGSTSFAVARYGNVTASRGSVIPRWREMLAKGQTALPVTSPFCTRYWLTLDQSVDMVLWTFANMSGGELVVPDMPAYQVSDLVEAMGGRPHTIGLRPGEKVHETIVSENEAPAFGRLGPYWVAGRETNLKLEGELSSAAARRMTVAEIRERLVGLGLAASQLAAAS